ncbi:unnamed protein product, partial [Allacma fusca]
SVRFQNHNYFSILKFLYEHRTVHEKIARPPHVC